MPRESSVYLEDIVTAAARVPALVAWHLGGLLDRTVGDLLPKLGPGNEPGDAVP